MREICTTYLEMSDIGQFRPKECDDSRFQILEAKVKQWCVNRFLYEEIGSKWGWTDKCSWSDDQWRACIESVDYTTFIAYYDGSIAGYFELSKLNDEVEIVYIGLFSSFIGKGFGGPLLSRAIEEAWALNPSRVWVHTCDLDHESAVLNYEARGMVPYKTEAKPCDG